MPELPVDPGHAGDKAVGLQGAQHAPGLGIDLMDPALAVLAHPQAALGPRHAGRAVAAGHRNGREHLAGLGIHLLDVPVGDLVEMRAVKGRARIGGDVERARRPAAGRVKRDKARPGGEPHLLAVVGQPVHGVDAGKRAILAEDLGLRSFHGGVRPFLVGPSMLVAGHDVRE
ncbi:hypothetical protein D3C72_1726220 [compost metagenome]